MSHGPSSLLLVALALSGVGLLGGPLILSLGRGRATTTAIVEGLTLGLVPTMVLLRLLPHVAEELGPLAIGLAAAAFLALRAFDRAHHREAARVGRAFIYSALALHSFTDGVSLAASVAATPRGGTPDVHGLTLTLAFVIHRLPEGLFIATTLLPSYGWRRTALRIAGLFAATVAGGLGGGALLPYLSERWFDGVVALGLGAMLQLVLHSHADRAATASSRALASLALIAGAFIAVAVPAPHDLLGMAQPRELAVVESFGPLVVETAPVLLVALVLSALVHTLGRPPLPLGPEAAQGGALRGALRGLLFAAAVPVGPSGAVPTARGLALRGAPLSAMVTFALAAPALTIDGALLSAHLLGLRFTLLRLGCALLLALAWALLGPRSRPPTPLHAPSPSPPAPLSATPRAWRRTWGSVATLVNRAVDQLGVWYLAGLAIAAALEAAVDPAWVAQLSAPLPTIAVLLVALPLNLPMLTLVPIAAVLLHKGLSQSAVLTLLLLGPTASSGLFRLLGGARLVARAVLAARLAAVTVCITIVATRVTPTLLPALHGLVAHQHHLGEWILAGTLGVLLVASLMRLGPRLWFGQLVFGGESRVDDHDHGHHHDHGH